MTTTATTTKAQRERRTALAVEFAVLLLTVAWAALLLQSGSEHMPSSDVRSANVLLVLLVLLLAASGAAAQLVPTRIPVQLRIVFRPERDAGLTVGCALVPLTLLSRLLAELYQEQVLSGFTFVYAWTSVSITASALIRLVVLRSSSHYITIATDLLVAPALVYFIEPTTRGVLLRSVLPALCQCTVSAVLAYGVHALPRSFTLGEALLVAQGVGMAAFDLALFSLSVIMGFSATTDAMLRTWGIVSVERSDYVLALQVGVVSSLLVCAALAPLLRMHGAASPSIIAAPLAPRQCVAFAARSLAVVVGVAYPWSCLVLETRNPFEWLVMFLLAHASRALLVVYWLACLALLVPLFAFLVDRFAIRTIIARKLFHALVVLMFVPAYVADAPMLALSYGVALSVFCLVECVRAVSLPPAGHHIATFMKTFIDHRDAGRVILTHTYLLLGCALPLWLSPAQSSARPNASHALAANAGILALGIGDAMGAAVGSSCGKRRLIGSKTLEGTLAILASIVLASVYFHDFHSQLLYHGRHEQLVLFVVGAVLTSVLETVTAQIDNLVLPLFFFAVCNLVACHCV